MEPTPQESIYYKRSRFSTRLPADRLYTQSHYWIAEEQPGFWRVGLTKFATRMLGDLVEYGFAVKGGDRVRVGQSIGWIEGFKAVTDLYCVVEGKFTGGSPQLEWDVTLLDSDPYGEGWLYHVQGKPEAGAVDVHGYIGILDVTIDRMLQKQPERKDDA